jgi:hypothetical protein
MLLSIVELVNADSPIDVTPYGIMTSVSLLFENALLPMLVTPLGIVILVMSRRPLKANSPMLVTELGITDELVPTIS